MAITIEANYSKKLGLPEYSSHQYSVTVRTEVTDLSAIRQESAQLYELLQESVDREMRNPGWLPGREPHQNAGPVNGNGSVNGNGDGGDGWHCSEKQRSLILKIVQENGLDRTEVDSLARQRCGAGVRELNKMQASTLIDELLGVYAKAPTNGNGRKHHAFRGGASNGRGVS